MHRTVISCFVNSDVFNKGLLSKTEMEEKHSSMSSSVSLSSSSSSKSLPVTAINEVFLDRSVFLNQLSRIEDSDSSSDDESSQRIKKSVYTYNDCSIPVN